MTPARIARAACEATDHNVDVVARDDGIVQAGVRASHSELEHDVDGADGRSGDDLALGEGAALDEDVVDAPPALIVTPSTPGVRMTSGGSSLRRESPEAGRKLRAARRQCRSGS